VKRACKLGWVLWFGVTLAPSGCTTTPPSEWVRYTPQPDQVAEPQKTIEQLLMAQPSRESKLTDRYGTTVYTHIGPPFKVEVTDAYFTTTDENGNTQIVPFAKFGGRGQIMHSDNTEQDPPYSTWLYSYSGDCLFVYEGTAIAPVQRFIDAVTAAKARAPRTP
jgi:hypothetical protein